MNDPADWAPIPTWVPQPSVVHRCRVESHDTVTLHLSATEGSSGAEVVKPRAGQFNMLYLFGRGEAPISISGNSPRSGNIHHTVKAAGPLTRAMTELKPGDRVGLRGPFGNPWPLAAARKRNVLLMAGGIGMAPLRAALRDIVRHRKRYGRVDVVYGSRSPQEILFRKQLTRWQTNNDINVHLTVDHSDAEWDGPVGFVIALLPQVNLDPGNTTAFVCGPEVMMRHGLSQLLGMGLAPSDVYLSMERSMRCAIGICGHCQWGADFICRQGPVFAADRIRHKLQIQEL